MIVWRREIEQDGVAIGVDSVLDMVAWACVRVVFPRGQAPNPNIAERRNGARKGDMGFVYARKEVGVKWW